MRSSHRSILTAVVLAVGVSVPLLLAVEASREPACDRACLIELTNNYLAAMLAHNGSSARIASDFRATENDQPVRLGEGVWKSAKDVAFRQSFADPATGEAGFFGVLTEQTGDRALFVLRLKTDGRRIREAGTLVARTPQNLVSSGSRQ